MKFAGYAIINSECLHTVHIEKTGSSASDGKKFLEILAGDMTEKLQHINISEECNWFVDGAGCLGLLLDLMAK